MTVGQRGYLGECLGIHLGFEVHKLHRSAHSHRIRSHRLAAHGYRIDSDAKAFGYLGSRQRGDITHVIAAVGQQNHHLALRFAVFQSGNGICQTHAHGGSVFNQSALGNICPDVFKQI